VQNRTCLVAPEAGADDRPEPQYFAQLDADDDDQTRRLVAEKGPSEGAAG
jgi:hypothetical protein